MQFPAALEGERVGGPQPGGTGGGQVSRAVRLPHDLGTGPSASGGLRAPSRGGEGGGELHLKLGIGKGVLSWPDTMIVCFALRTLPGPHLEWAWPSPRVGLSHQIWVLINRDHCEIK